MKTNFFIAILLMTLFASCSSEDDTITENTTETNYFPLENGDFWVYDVSGEFPGRDSLYVANDTVISNTTHKKLKTKDLAFGFYTSSLANNGVRKSGDQLMISGTAAFDLLEGFPIDLAVSDFVIFKESASENQQLSSTSGTLTYNFEEIPLTFNYTMKSVAGASLENYNVPNYGNFEDVKVVKIIVNLKISSIVAAGPVNLPIDVLSEQDVVVATQYYAKNVGMIYSTTDISYELQDFSSLGFELPIPASGSQNIKEYLADYSVSATAN